MNKNRKLRFNAIDVLILLLIAAVILRGSECLCIEFGRQSKQQCEL